MPSTVLAYISLGAAILAVAWLPLLLRKLPLSLPTVAVAVGAAAGWFTGAGTLPFAHREILQDLERLWAVLGLTVLLSMIVYGVSANPIMQRLDAHCRWRGGTD